MKRSKHGLLVFPPKRTLIRRRHCSIGQSCCSMTSKRFLESSSGMKFFQPSFRLTNQKRRAFVSVRQTNQIALFLFVCCFCFVRTFSFQGHTKIALSNMSRSFSYNIKTPSSNISNTRKSVSSDIKTQRGVTTNTRRSIRYTNTEK